MISNKGLGYTLAREYYRWHDKINAAQNKRFNAALKLKYQREYTNQGLNLKKVYIHNLGSEWFYTSTLHSDYQFELINSPESADLVIFITTIDKELASQMSGKQVGLFFREPSSYVSHFKNQIPKSFFENNSVFVVTHLEKSQAGLTNFDSAQIIHSFFYPHYHHWATADELNKYANKERRGEIFSLTSGLSGIAGNINRRKFIERLSEENPSFDLYGRFTKDSFQLKAYRGLCAFKKNLLFKYKYNLVIENTNECLYISEKIFDALICGCMPIYHGTEKIFDLIPKEWFYYLPTLDVAEIEKLNRFLKTDAYLTVLNNRKMIAEYIDEKFSFYRCIEKILCEREVGIPKSFKIS